MSALTSRRVRAWNTLPRIALNVHPLALLGAEPFRAAMELAWHQFAMSDDAKPGDGHPVVIFPGLGSDGSSVATLRAHCRALGYDAFDWGQGFNTGPQGDLDVWLHTLKSQVIDLLAGHTQPATLIGWSLGGLYAREIAKLMAPRIRQVITMGTPFNVRADNTNGGALLRILSGTSSPMNSALNLRLRTPPPMCITLIYSRSGHATGMCARSEHDARCAHNPFEIHQSLEI